MSPELEDNYEEDNYDGSGIAAIIVLCIFCPIIPIALFLDYLDKKDRENMEKNRREKKKESYINDLEQDFLKRQEAYFKKQERSKDEKNI